MKNKLDIKSIIYSFVFAIVIFILTIVALSILGLSPKFFTITPQIPFVENENQIIDISSERYTRPNQIIIDKIDVNSIINQPQNPDVDILDQALQSGAVHYPGSGSIERGNMFIFGHSTNWQIVQNEAYKTFNNLNKLQTGDEIKIIANGETYLYKVSSVNLVDENNALVTFDSSKRKLTISTCDTFGRKQDRWVVEAVFDKKV